MTSLPQTHPRTLAAQESRRRTPSVAAENAPSPDGTAPDRAREPLPAVDPSCVFGCVDWFLYPDQATGRSAVERRA